MLRTPTQSLHSAQCYAPGRTKRVGIMLHFDDSSEDKWAVAWFRDPACHVSYNRLYLDNGDVVEITPSIEHVAWHAGVCTVKNANSKFYGLSAATNTKVPVTQKQFDSIVNDCVALFQKNGWTKADVEKRIVGHEDLACFASGKLGRKIDPTGLHHEKPILSTHDVREAVKSKL